MNGPDPPSHVIGPHPLVKRELFLCFVWYADRGYIMADMIKFSGVLQNHMLNTG